MRATSTLVCLTVTGLLASAPAAWGKAPPRGKYRCDYGAGQGYTLTILKRGKYTISPTQRGRFTTKGRRITFATGELSRVYYGKWRYLAGGGSEIELFSIVGNPLTTKCRRRAPA